MLTEWDNVHEIYIGGTILYPVWNKRTERNRTEERERKKRRLTMQKNNPVEKMIRG